MPPARPGCSSRPSASDRIDAEQHARQFRAAGADEAGEPEDFARVEVEVDIVGQADTTVVVVNPGWGDAVQANKAGLMEIADVFVINKADRDGVRQTRHDLRAVVEMGERRDWTPPVVETVALDGTGTGELWDAITAHRDHLIASGELVRKRARRLEGELRSIVVERLRGHAEELLGPKAAVALVDEVRAGRLDPYAAADRLLDTIGA